MKEKDMKMWRRILAEEVGSSSSYAEHTQSLIRARDGHQMKESVQLGKWQLCRLVEVNLPARQKCLLHRPASTRLSERKIYCLDFVLFGIMLSRRVGKKCIPLTVPTGLILLALTLTPFLSLFCTHTHTCI